VELKMTENIPPTFLSIKNAHPRDAFISFEEKSHVYTVHGKQGYTSVTTFNHHHFAEFDADKIIDKIIGGKNWNDPSYKYYQMTKDQIRDLWNANGKSASSLGTKIHYDIECFMNQELIDEDGEPIETTHYWLKILFQQEEEEGILQRNNSTEWKYFIKYVDDHPYFKPYRTEWFVYDEELKLAGSIDMVYENPDGSLMIYDWKRSKEIKYEDMFNKSAITKCIDHLPDTNFWHYSLQLNTYKAILEKNYGKRITDLYLVILHPDNPKQSYELIKCADLSKEVADLFNNRKKELLENK
jgi:hypothetical protein